MERLKSYSHLLPDQVPDDYMITTSRLLYHKGKGFEIHMPMTEWHDQFSHFFGLTKEEMEEFDDPYRLTYMSYVSMQVEEVHYLERLHEGIFSIHEKNAKAIKHFAQDILSPLRFACHGLQMISSYLGSMAPTGKLAVVSLLQSADEQKRLEVLSLILESLEKSGIDFKDSLEKWTQEPIWQPFRLVFEEVLQIYQWDECWIALNDSLKHVFDTFFFTQIVPSCKAMGMFDFCRMLSALKKDSDRHAATHLALQSFLVDKGKKMTVCQGIADRARKASSLVFGGNID